MRALASTSSGGVEFVDVPPPAPKPHQAVIEVSASAVNRGDLVTLRRSPAGTVLGLDVVGTVVEAAADGSGPAPGTRVMGYTGVRAGGWAETTVLDTFLLAPIPDGLTDAQAACLPNGGLTGLSALDAFGRPLLGARVLVTGATGGVGWLTVQLAHLAGATVTGTVTSAARAAQLAGFPWLETALVEEATGPYDLIVDLVGGEVLTHALNVVAADGTVATLAQTSQDTASVPGFWFGLHPGARMVSVVNGHHQGQAGSGPRNLDLLARLAAAGRLDAGVTSEAAWEQAPALLKLLDDRKITGKAVLHVRG